MSWEHILLVFIAGIVCGIINTLAGSGSLISLPILIFIGLPANVANGTNRIGIFFQNIVSTINFKRQNVLDVKMGFRVAIPSILGSITGAMIVLELHERAVEITVAIVLLIMLVPLWMKPSRWLKGAAHDEIKSYPVLQFIIFFFIGAYGGFIQAGVGIFLLSALVLTAGYDLVRANALKVFINLIFTPFALAVFVIQGQIDIRAGLVLALGNSIGAYFASKYAVSWGSAFVRYVLIAVIIIAGIKLLFFP
ncbi:MAG: sulfite exporter TauE/SafE family protein [Bacteroidetes bacterium]|nr:MAG: sulfite exporter TauE/SafE family protein [Bacteroidota bacterium]